MAIADSIICQVITTQLYKRGYHSMKKILCETIMALKNGLKPFTVWLICLPINLLPALFKSLSNNEANISSYSINLVFMGILKDSDFMFVFVAALCALYIQTQWEWVKNGVFDKTCKVVLLIVLGLFFIEYIIIRFFPTFKKEVFDKNCIELSIALLLTVLVFSLIVHTVIAYYKNREAKH